MAQQTPPFSVEAAFQIAYKNWCMKTNLNVDPQRLVHEGWQINLYQLHVCVHSAGGHTAVDAMDLWAAIAGRLGFVQLPETDTAPDTSGPGVAQWVQNVYGEYLATFDDAFMRSVIYRRQREPTRMARLQGMQGGTSQMNAGVIMNAAGQQQPQLLSEASLDSIAAIAGVSGPQRESKLLLYSEFSVGELQAQGLPHNVISAVETHRHSLQRTLATQRQFHNVLMNQPSIGMSEKQLAFHHAQANNLANGHLDQGWHPTQIVSQPHASPSNYVNGVGRQQTTVNDMTLFLSRPTSEAMRNAMIFVNNIRAEYQDQMPNMIATCSKVVPDDQRLAYNTIFEQLFRYVSEIDPKLHIFACFFREEGSRKLTGIVTTVHQQRALLSSDTPRYILDLSTVLMMLKQTEDAIEAFSIIVLRAFAGANASQPQLPESANTQIQSSSTTDYLAPSIPPQAADTSPIPFSVPATNADDGQPARVPSPSESTE